MRFSRCYVTFTNGLLSLLLWTIAVAERDANQVVLQVRPDAKASHNVSHAGGRRHHRRGVPHAGVPDAPNGQAPNPHKDLAPDTPTSSVGNQGLKGPITPTVGAGEYSPADVKEVRHSDENVEEMALDPYEAWSMLFNQYATYAPAAFVLLLGCTSALRMTQYEEYPLLQQVRNSITDWGFGQSSQRASTAFFDVHNIQWMQCLNIFFGMATMTVFLPSSTGLLRHILHGHDHYVTLSGALVGAIFILSGISAILSLYFMKFTEYKVQKKLIVGSLVAMGLACATFALVAAVDRLPKHAAVALLFGSRISQGVAMGMFMSLGQSTVNTITAKRHTTDYFVCLNFCRVAGLGFGPLISAGICHLVGTSSISVEAGAPIAFLAACWAVLAARAYVHMPEDLEPLVQLKMDIDKQDSPALYRQDDNSPQVSETVSCQQNGTGCGPGENGKFSTSALIWITGFFYCVERALCVSALEAATVLILETDFHCKVNTAGFLVGISFLMALPVSLLVDTCRKTGWVKDATLLKLASLVSVVCSVFFFPAFGHAAGLGNYGRMCLLIFANGLLMSFLYIGNGMVEALIICNCTPGTFFTQENFVAYGDLLAQDTFGRFAGPVISRYLLEGRSSESYAIFQLLLCSFGLVLCFIINSLVQSTAPDKGALAMESQADIVEVYPRAEPEPEPVQS